MPARIKRDMHPEIRVLSRLAHLPLGVLGGIGARWTSAPLCQDDRQSKPWQVAEKRFKLGEVA